MVQQDLEADQHLAADEQDEVRVLLVGDPGVGKTSLVYSLVNDEFVPNPPAKMANITIPAEVTSENVPLYIEDFSEQEQSLEDLKVSVQDADVICIVFNAGDDSSIFRVATHWIPTVRKYQPEYIGSYKPIILVANKLDLVEEDGPLDQISTIIQEFVDIEAYIEVSARTQKNVVELFSSAQKAVMYPLAPLFDPLMRVLSTKCQKALINIFRLCDMDGDGLLSDHELNLFQEDVFGIPLQKDALDDLKSIIKQSTMDGIINDGMTQTGFLFLHTLSIDKGRHDFTWQVLRKFNYDNQINLIDGGSSSSSGQMSEENLISGGTNFTAQHGGMTETKSTTISSGSHEEGLNFFDTDWLKDQSRIIYTGLGLTVATLFGVLALRCLYQNNFRGSAQ